MNISDHKNINRFVLSSPINSKFKRISGVLTDKGYKLEKLTEKQSFTEIIDTAGINEYFETAIKTDFRNLTVWDENFEYSYRVSKKGKLLYNRSRNNTVNIESTSHNREKNYIIKDGIYAPPLVDMGLQTADGKVKASMQDKFRQLNRFIEIIDDKISEIPLDKTIKIVDFGCGKSYLTFAIYYYLTELKCRSVKMVGLDLKRDVITKCNDAAVRYGYENLKFYHGDISDANKKDFDNFDIMITLHACDTATDYALYYAITHHIKHIFSVPCCQKEINSQINSQVKVNVFPLMLSHGLTKERFSALLTDTIRSGLLTANGYKVDLMEFVGFEATPKNLLIRGTLSNVNKKKRNDSLDEVKKALNFFGIKQTLFTLLYGDNYD
ncbi:MAG: SAM-dependent methyltransferase [Ruminococcus sp.]|jgi:SAM-dependent methyltransferase|nr:SAM-dependent methyltransferase [Ruminococcus sp.]